MRRRIQLALALFFIMISLPFLIWGFWPPRRVTTIVPMLPSKVGLTLNEARTIRLEFSPAIRAGDSEIVRLWLEPAKQYQADKLYEEYTVIAEARLELPFANVRPANIISTPLAPGGSASFYWEVAPGELGTLRGTLWVYLRFIPKQGGDEIRQPVSAQMVEIRSGSMGGRTGSQARAVGAAGFAVGLALGIPWVWKRRKAVPQNLSADSQSSKT